MDKATTSVSSSRNGGLEQVLSDLKALKKLYGLLHKGPADENLDETSRALLMKMLDDATQQALLKQAKLLSGSLMSPALERKLSVRSDRRTPDAADEPPLSLKPPASPSPSLLAGERSSQLNKQDSTLSRRAGGHVVDGNRQAAEAEEPLLARLASYRSSRTTASALPPRHHRPGGDHRSSGLSLYRLPVPAPASQHGTVTRDRTRRTSGRGDPQSPEGSSRRRPVSRQVSRLHGRGTGRHVGAGSSPAARRLGRLGSGVSSSRSKVSRRGSERAGRGGVATPPEQSSSSNTVATIRSRIRPNQEHYKERCPSRSEEDEEESTPRRRRRDASISSSGSHDLSSPTEGSSSRRSSVSRELSLGQALRHGRGTTRRVGGEGSYSKRRLGRMGSRLSQGLASRRGSEQAGRGGAASRGRSSAGSSCSRLPRRALKRIDSGSKYVSSSSGAAVSCPSTSRTVSPEASASASYSPPPVSQRGTAQSRPPPRGTAQSRPPPVSPRGTAHSRPPPVSPRGTAHSTPPPVSPRGTAYSRPPPVSPRVTAYSRPPPVSQRGTAYTPQPPVSQWGWGTPYSPPPPVSHRGIAWPLHAPQVSRLMRRRRRQEILQKRVERLRILKDKIAMVFHHHHHHHYGRGQEGPSSSRIPREHQIKSPWQYLGGIFHHTRGRDTKTASRALVEAPAKKRGGGGGGNVLALFDAMRRHLQSKRRTTASVKMRRMANRSRVQAKKMHWWQQLGARRGRAAEVMAGGRPRRRLGLGKGRR